MDSGVWLKPVGPFETATVKGRLKSPLIVTFTLPLSELLQVSSETFKENVSTGIGLGSQTSPKPSSSKSFWSALAVLGQLSTSFLIPSLSKSLESTYKLIPTGSMVSPGAVATTCKG